MLQDPMSMTMEDLRAAPVPRHLLDRVIDERAHCLGKGSNNKAFAVRCDDGTRRVLRAPRRRSDTQQHQNALWEFRQTLAASQMGVAPEVHEAWFARHALGEHWTSGLYLIMDEYACNLEEAMCQPGPMREKLLADDGAALRRVTTDVVHLLSKLAKAHMLVFDLKPSNVVVRDGPDGTVDVRIVDFGRDFCEWDVRDDEARAPIIRALREKILRRDDQDAEECAENVDAVVAHILFACMLVQLAATTTHNLYEDRERYRMDRAHRTAINLFAPMAAELLESMQGRNVALLRWVLRDDQVRGVMQHYHGRRNGGTHRTFAYARGVETFGTSDGRLLSTDPSRRAVSIAPS